MVEYDHETESISLSDFTNTCVSWTDINNLYPYQHAKLKELIEKKERSFFVGLNTKVVFIVRDTSMDM